MRFTGGHSFVQHFGLVVQSFQEGGVGRHVVSQVVGHVKIEAPALGIRVDPVLGGSQLNF